MKTKLGLMAACAAMAMAAETGNSQTVVWGGGSTVYARFSVGSPCAPRVVTYVPVIVTAPACAWGSGTRTILVPSWPARVVYANPPAVYHRPPVARFDGRGQHGRPAYGRSYSSHGSRGDGRRR